MEKDKPRPVGRPRNFDEDQALDAAMRVFWKKGYEGASTSDLTAAMGIQPASLYHAFGNKQQLFERAVARYLAGPAAFMDEALDAPTAYEVADRILRGCAVFLTHRRAPRGCMTIQAAMTGGQKAASVRRHLTAVRLKAQDDLQARFERARREGDLPKDTHAADLARFVTTIFQGMTVQSVNGASRDELLRLADIALRAWPR